MSCLHIPSWAFSRECQPAQLLRQTLTENVDLALGEEILRAGREQHGPGCFETRMKEGGGCPLCSEELVFPGLQLINY